MSTHAVIDRFLNSIRLKRYLLNIAMTLFLSIQAFGAESQDDIENGVRLVLSSKQIEPTTTFELRFNEPMIPYDKVGSVAAESPLVISPAIPGKFTWLSMRSGIFKPSEAPALGTIYKATLLPGLKNASGVQPAAALNRTFQTPPFTATGFSPKNFPEKNAPSNPEIHIQLNLDVNADAAKKFIVFRNDENVEVPALVSQTKRGDDYYFPGGEPRTWKDRFAGRQPVTSQSQPKDRESVIPNCLFVTPTKPLPVGKGWRLVMEKGLPSSDGTVQFAAPSELKIGEVIPFNVTEVRANNGIEEGRHITVNFSKRISPMLKSEDLGKWISISPVPAAFHMEPNWDQITMSGDFKLPEHYSVTVKSGFPSAVPFVTGSDCTQTVAFTPLPPRLYFPAFSTHQINGGLRRFDLRSVNLPDVLVQARLLTRDSLVPALRGYNGMYYKESSGEGEEYEPYQKFDPFILSGKTVFEKHLPSGVERDTTKITSLNWDDILGARKSGAVLLSAEGNFGRKLGTQSLVQITDLGLIWKYAAGEVLVYVFSHATGLPVEGALVHAISDDNTTLTTQKTGDNGIAQFAVPENTGWLLAEKEGDLHAVSFRAFNEERGITDREEHDLPLWHFGIPLRWYRDRDREIRRVLLFTERPAYQPGETVHLKGIIRDWKAGEPVVPEGLNCTLRCEDSRREKFFEQKVSFSSTGAFDVSFSLPKGAVGNYEYSLSIAGDIHSYGGNFRVEEYRPNAFEISVAGRKSFGADEKIEVPFTAKYFFGTPLAKARIKWSIEASDQVFQPDGFRKFSFDANPSREEGPAPENAASFSIQGEGAVDANGSFVLQPKITTDPKTPQPRSVSVLAEITDLNQQTISTRTSFVKQSSDFYLGVKAPGEDLPAGKPVPVEFVAVNADGKPHAGTVSARVELQRIDYHTVREEGAGGALKYRNVPETISISRQQGTSGIVKKSGNDWELEPQGNPTCVTPPVPGEYVLRISTRDAAGHEILNVSTFNVVDKKPVLTSWAYRNQAQIDLVPDKSAYAPGESALILVKTPINGEALVTVEREKVMRSFVAKLEGNAPTIRVPLERNDAPNIFVSVILVRGHEQSPHKIKTPDYRIGYCQVNVVRPETRLEVSVKPDAPGYQPGREAGIDAEVKDSTGANVSGAEVTLYAVDEGVLSLTGFTRPDPFSFFYSAQPLAVRSASSLPALFPEDPEQLVFSNKGYLVGDKGDEEGKGRVRKDFLACAFWKADLTTDAGGKVHATFKAPDSLTRYRIVAVVQTARGQFGSAESGFEINKPLMLEPSLPRFGNITDKITARAVLFNRTEKAGDVEFSVQLDERAACNGATVFSSTVRIPANSSTTIDFPVEFKQPGETKWTWHARMSTAGKEGGTFEDAVQSTLNVGFIAPLFHETLVGRTSDADANLLANVNPQLLEATGTMNVRLANTRLLGLGGAVVYLQAYPYGCVEQTSSKMIPWILASSLENAVPELKKSQEEIHASIEWGINRILSMQTPSGGLSYWPGGRQPMLWATAYGGFALATARRYGHPVPVSCLDKICDYLKKELRDISECRDEFELGPRCLALYTLALSGHAEPGYHEAVYKIREALSAESRALLALAILESNGPREMVEELINSKMPAQPQEGFWFGSSERELSVRLMAWSRHRPADPAVDVLAEELLHARQHGRWRNTQENAWALLALTTYAAQVETGLKSFGGTLSYGAASGTFHFDSNSHLFEAAHAIKPVTAENTEPQPLKLSNPEKGLVFTTVQIEGRPRVGMQPAQDRGYSIQRRYDKINDDGTRVETKNWRVGDRVLVTIRIEVRQPAHYLAVDDPLPAVFEAVNPAFKTQEMNSGLEPALDWFTDYREIRSDRALFFGDHIPPGNYTIRYLARVCAPGNVTAPAVKIEEMYHPERFGMSATEEVSSSSTK